MAAFPRHAKEWNSAEIAADCARAKADFRARRTAGPLNDYLLEFPSAQAAADNIDFVVGLKRGRTLALEAKASNTEIDSRKRLNKEVVVDAQHLQTHFGTQAVSAAALGGVFKPEYVEAAQGTPLVIYWGHRLDDLKAFLAAT